MIPEFDRNAAFIWACYAAGAIPILLAIAHTALRARKARHQLDRLTAETGEKGAT